MQYKVAELMLFTTCNYDCAYCGFATSGAVRDTRDLAPFQDKEYIDKIYDFFEKHSTAEQKWILHMSGGEPLLMPNLGYFARKFIQAGHKLAYNTNLSLPIESNGWMDDHPPEGIDSIIASLHAQSLGQIDKICNRVKILRDAGYPIVVRMVAHPQFIPEFPRFEKVFHDAGVSFAVNAFYSPTYPQAYTERERDTVIRYMRTNYQVIQLKGGLDMRGRKCRAGTDIICVALGASGGGEIYPCVSTSEPRLRMGNIFEGEVNFFNKDVGCMRADKICSCAIHFTHGAVPFADDTEAQTRMLTGCPDSVAETWSQWFKERGIKTKFHAGAPQGTSEGEKNVVLAERGLKDKKLNDLLRDKGKPVTLPEFREWASQGSTQWGVESTTGVKFASQPTKYGYLAISPQVSLKAGLYQLRCKATLETGGITLGIQEHDGSAWIHQHNVQSTGYMRTNFSLDSDRRIRLVLAACNHFREENCTGQLEQMQLIGAHDRWALVSQRIATRYAELADFWLLQAKPRLLLRKLYMSAHVGRGLAAIARTFRFKGYYHMDVLPAGYAVRSIAYLSDANRPCLVTADIGNDTMSVIPLEKGRATTRKVIQFPERSTPMYLSSVKNADGSQGLLACFFNFDQSEESSNKTTVAYIKDIGSIENLGQVETVSDIGEIVLSRNGYWGFRGTKVIEDASGKQYIAAVDRELSQLHIRIGHINQSISNYSHTVVDLGEGVEPIGINGSLAQDGRPVFYATSRGEERLLVVKQNEHDQWHLSQSIDVGGLSRSSLAIGCFSRRDEKCVALGTWGGNPEDLNTPHQGQVVIGTLDEAGTITGLETLPGGIHPTDVAAGDLDGDGLDELVVINYGTGLGMKDRRHPGGIDIFKHQGGEWRKVASWALANPRIALIDDIDGDGKLELVVSLFFEERLAVFKYATR